jgi:predicted RNA-binding protein with PUA-like domain
MISYMEVWVAVGSAQNSRTSFKNNKWGVNSRLRGAWEKIAVGDLMVFYVTNPVGGIVGVASVEGKAEEELMLWRDEYAVGRVLYPFRVNFKPIFVLEEERWSTDKVTIKGLRISVQSGINHVKNEDALKILLNRVSKSWGIRVGSKS